MTVQAVLAPKAHKPESGFNAAKFKKLRDERGWSNRDVARHTGIHPSTISAYLRGTRSPGAKQLMLLADAFNVDPRQFWETPAQKLADFAQAAAPQEPPRWSISKVHDYLRCPALYFFRHVSNIEIQTVSVDLAIGSAVHRGVEALLKNRMGQEGGDPEKAIQASLELDAPHLEPADEGEEPPALDDLRQESVQLLKLYAENIAPAFKPIAVEQRVEFELGGTLFTAVIDTITEDYTVRDLKTSRRRPSESDIAENIQATAYSRGFRALTGEPAKSVTFDYLIRKKKPEAVSIESQRDAKDEARLERIVEGVVRAVDQGHFYPNPTNKFGCKGCPYNAICKETF